jgi:hypothetical protein
MSDFSLARGGPAYTLLRVLGLPLDTRAGAARAALVLAAVAWLPLLVLTVAQGTALGDAVQLPLLHDVSVFVRFLFSLPLFVLAGPVIDRKLATVIDHLVAGGIVPESQRAQYNDARVRLERSRDGWLPELILLALVASFVWVDAHKGPMHEFSTWASSQSPPGTTWAGAWYSYVSLPLFGFFGVRWIWRELIWARFLLRVSRLNLDLVPSHPDRVGGLGFVARANSGFNLVVAALAATLGATAAIRILFVNESLNSLRWVLLAFVIIMVILFQGPFLVFTLALARARQRGLFTFTRLAAHYSRLFERKWTAASPDAAGAAGSEPLLGTPDIQSLADLGSGYDVVARMRVLLAEPPQVIVLLASAVIPMIPPLAVVVPISDILEKLLRLLGR